MLVIALELGGVLAQNALEHRRTHEVGVSIPHLDQSLRVGHHETTISAKRVFNLKLLDECELRLQKVLRQLVTIAQTLN